MFVKWLFARQDIKWPAGRRSKPPGHPRASARRRRAYLLRARGHAHVARRSGGRRRDDPRCRVLAFQGQGRSLSCDVRSCDVASGCDVRACRRGCPDRSPRHAARAVHRCPAEPGWRSARAEGLRNRLSQERARRRAGRPRKRASAGTLRLPRADRRHYEAKCRGGSVTGRSRPHAGDPRVARADGRDHARMGARPCSAYRSSTRAAAGSSSTPTIAPRLERPQRRPPRRRPARRAVAVDDRRCDAPYSRTRAARWPSAARMGGGQRAERARRPSKAREARSARRRAIDTKHVMMRIASRPTARSERGGCFTPRIAAGPRGRSR